MSSSKIYSQNSEEQNLFVFVGKKLSVEEFQPKLEEGLILTSSAFRSRYVVLQQVYNKLETDTVEFIAYDHYGEPAFSHFEHVLIYIAETEDGFIHEDYLFSPLFKTKENKWASPYPKADYDHPRNQNTSIVPVVIDWEKEQSFEVTNLEYSKIKTYYPEPFYKIDGKKVTAVFGNYLQELFILKQNGFLRARGYFND